MRCVAGIIGAIGNNATGIAGTSWQCGLLPLKAGDDELPWSNIIQAIVDGKQPPELTANKLVRLKNLPVDWPGQREYLGFPAA